MECVDVLLATYNGEKYLRELLDSIVNQSYKNIRILICDDCSTDQTYEVLKKFGNKDKRIVLFKNEINIGSDKTFEYLMSKVESNFFMIADQDDVWYLDKIEMSLKKLYEEDADLVFTDLEVVDKNLNLISNSFNKTMKYNYKIKKYINDGYKMELLSNVITGCTILAKKKWINSFLPIPNNKNILYDYWIGLVIALNGKLAYLDKPTLKYRQHENNQVGTKKYTDTLDTFEKVREYLIDLRIQNFETFIERENIFNESQKKNNILALNYYKTIKFKKYINFNSIIKFHNLYKYDRIGVYLPLLFIMNFPSIAKLIYNFRNLIKRM